MSEHFIQDTESMTEIAAETCLHVPTGNIHLQTQEN